MSPDVTQQYRFPPASLTGPPAEELSPEQLLEVARRAIASVTDLRALQTSPSHLLRLCEMFDTLHAHVVTQEAELGETRKRLSAAGRMVAGARDQAAIVRHALDREVAAHQATRQRADQEHDRRIVVEEELRREAEAHVREVAAHVGDSERLARAMLLIEQLSDPRVRQLRRRAGGTPLAVQIPQRPSVVTLAVPGEVDTCSNDLDTEKTVVDVQDILDGLDGLDGI
jgi:hypothetical protein